MAYSIRDRLSYIGVRQNQVRGELIEYQRGPDLGARISIYAVPGHTDVQDLTPHTIVSQARYVDFIINKTDLRLPGVGLFLPQRGDRVIWEGNTYVVTPPTDVDEVYQPTTMYRDRIRIHTLLTRVISPAQ